MSDVVVVGSFNVDHVWQCTRLPTAGATLAGEYRSGPGGKGFNQAVAAARAGARTTFVCALGDDAGGQGARALAAADHIDLRAADSTQATGTAGIFVDAQGRNSIVIGAGANAALSVAFIAAQAGAIAASQVLLAQLESPLDAVVAALAQARAANATTVLNPAPANAMSTPALLALADILTPNESEFAALLARHADLHIDADAVAGSGDDDLQALARRLLPNGSVLLTLGAHGMFVSHPPSRTRGDDATHYRLPAAPAAVVDTTGAGDACNGALAASLALQPQAAFVAHARFANRYAALSTEHRGAATAMPLRADVHARFDADMAH